MLTHQMTIAQVFVFTPCRMDTLAFGAGVALLYRSRYWSRAAAASPYVALTLLGPLVFCYVVASAWWAQVLKFTCSGLFYAVVLVGWLSWHLWESHFLKLKSRFY